MKFPLKIPVGDMGGHSRLFMDYTAQGKTPVREILGGYSFADGAWEKKTAGSKTDASVVDSMISYNTRLGAAPDVLEKLDKAKGGDTRFVVTGQQPGLLGGPLLTLHKVFTAIALAAVVEKKYKRPCLPLFWMGADDTDFHEIRDFFTVTADLLPLETRLENDAYAAASPVGDIPVTAVAAVFESIEPFVDAYPRGAEIKNVLQSVLAGSADFGETAAGLISKLTGGNIAVIDGREGAVRDSARDLFLEYFDNEDKIKAEVARQGGKLDGLGYHSQLSLGPDSGVFQLDGGRRKKITAPEREAARERIKENARGFSPGVVLRNLVQDVVFNPVAVVLGPAEVAYRAQTAGVHKMLSVPAPVVVPRMTAAYVAPPLAEILRPGTRTDVLTLLTKPAAFARKVYETGVDETALSAAARLKDSFKTSVETFLETAGTSLDEKPLSRLTRGLADVERRLDRALETAGETGRARALARWPFLEGLADIVARNQKPQDRTLSMLTPFFFGGLRAAGSLDEAARLYVAGAMDGDTVHVVYST